MSKWRQSMGVAIFSLLAGCAAHTPAWTPETVAPPPTPPAEVVVEHTLEKTDPPQITPENKAVPVNLSRNSAILGALLNNRSIDVARFGPEIANTLTPEARAAFDPSLLGGVGLVHDKRAATASGQSSTTSVSGTTGNNTIDSTVALLEEIDKLLAMLNTTNSPVKSDIEIGSVGLREHLPTGADLAVTTSGGSLDSNYTDRQGINGWSVSLTQPLLQDAGLPVNLIALRQAKNKAAQSEYLFKQQVIDLVRQTDTAYWNLVLADNLLEIRRFAVRIADEQLTRNTALFGAGKIIEADVLASKAEKASRTADLTDAQANLRSQTLTLIQLLNPAITDPWGISFQPTDTPTPPEITVDEQSSEKLALQYRPDLAQARLILANNSLDVVRTKNALLPRLDLVGVYGDGETSSIVSSTTGMPTGSLSATDNTNYRIGLQFEQSITNRAEKARHRRAKLYETQAERNIAAIEQIIGREVRQAALEITKQRQRIQATGEAARSREEQLRVAQGRYDAGKITNLDLLIIQRDYIQSRIDQVTAQVQYIQAITALYTAEGTLLDRRGISLDLAQSGGPDKKNTDSHQPPHQEPAP